VTGFGRCAACGGNVRITHRVQGPAARRHSVRLSTCAVNDNLGLAKCPNNVVVKHEVLDQAVLGAIAGVLHPSVLDAAVSRAFAQLRADRSAAVGRRAELQREHQTAQQLATLDATLVDEAHLKPVLLAKVADVGALLAGDVQQGREVLRALLAVPLTC
jgi:hypothetical protein